MFLDVVRAACYPHRAAAMRIQAAQEVRRGSTRFILSEEEEEWVWKRSPKRLAESEDDMESNKIVAD